MQRTGQCAAIGEGKSNARAQPLPSYRSMRNNELRILISAPTLFPCWQFAPSQASCITGARRHGSQYFGAPFVRAHANLSPSNTRRCFHSAFCCSVVCICSISRTSRGAEARTSSSLVSQGLHGVDLRSLERRQKAGAQRDDRKQHRSADENQRFHSRHLE